MLFFQWLFACKYFYPFHALYFSSVEKNIVYGTKIIINKIIFSVSICLNIKFSLIMLAVFCKIHNVFFWRGNCEKCILYSFQSNWHGCYLFVFISGEINPTSEALLTNALFFKGFWRYAFNPKYTRVGCFYNEGICQKVSMMELYEDLYYAFVDNLRAHALELPYQVRQYLFISKFS